MYTVYLDDEYLYYPGDEIYCITDPVLKLTTGYAGEFRTGIQQGHPLYDKIKNRKSMLSVYRDDKEIFYGEVRSCQLDFRKEKMITAEGALSFLADTIQPQAEYHNLSPRQMLGRWLDIHNAQVEPRKRISIGIVSIHDSNDSLYRFTNRENTLTAIREKLVERLGGYLRLRHDNNQMYLDWITLEEYGKYCSQPIKFGLNLLDYSEDTTTDDLITCLIPLGAKLDANVQSDASEFDKLPRYVDIKSVNNGRDYIYNAKAVENFGWIWGTAHWDDVNVPMHLMQKGKQYLESVQYEQMTLELTAADLSLLKADYDTFELGDRILCEADPYGMHRVFPVMELSIPLQSPDDFRVTLGENRRLSYTERVSHAVRSAKEEAETHARIQTEWLGSSIDDLTKRMTGAKGGYKLSEYDESGLWVRDLYMDAPDKNLASRILQINSEGIGGSRNGYPGPYTVGIQLDGTILGERIKAGSIKSETLSTECKTYFERQISSAESASKEYAVAQVTSAVEASEGRINLSVQSIEHQLTQKKGIWYGTYVPTANNAPAINWDTEALRVSHNGDLYYNTQTGYAYQYHYSLNGLVPVVSWDRIRDMDIAAAKSAADAAQQNAAAALAQVSVLDGQIQLKVTKGEVESLIDQKANSIRLKASKISWSSTYSSMTESGVLTCNSAKLSGTFRCGSGYYLYLDGGKIKGGYNNTQYGYIDYSARIRNIDTGVLRNGIQIQGGALRISVNELATRKTNNVDTTAYIGGTGTLQYVERINALSDGGIEWQYGTLQFENGLMVTDI